MNAKVANPGANASAYDPRRAGAAGPAERIRAPSRHRGVPARMRRAGPARQRRAGIVGTRIRATLRALRVPSNP